MFGYLIAISILKQFRPYFRKYISNVLDHHEYFLLTAIMVLFILVMYILYLIYISGSTTFGKLVTNMSELSFLEVFLIFLIACFSVISSVALFELDKSHNTPSMNAIYIKSVSLIAVVCIGMFIFGESYKSHQIVGIALILIGIYLASQKKISMGGS